ncbi:MAG: MFS transporter [Anaerolineales bacterium]|nr:MFS transporter [Anaerolineales bacterium]
MLNRIRTTYHEYPSVFWVLVGSSFIDRIGGTMIQPFFALYITQKFQVGMTQAGVLLGIFSISGLVGSMIGGAITDKFGRKGMVLFGLVFSALSSVSMGLVSELSIFYVLAVVVGLLSSVADPAHHAMVADILPEEQRAEGFGVMRVAGNLAWIIGPTIGGLVASRSYLAVFILDAITSIITAFIVFRVIPETKPEVTEEQKTEKLLDTFKGYRKVFLDRPYIAYILTSMIMLLVYLQMYNTLSVFLRDVHGVPPQGYGLLLSLDAGVVVLLQFWVTRKVSKRPPLLMLALGTLFYMIGFSMYAFVGTYALFITAILIITIGEMIVVPVGQAVAARFAPDDMRGRYLAFYGLAWALPSAVGPAAAGFVLDNYQPELVWILAGILSAVAIVGYLGLHARLRDRFQPQNMAAEKKAELS